MFAFCTKSGRRLFCNTDSNFSRKYRVCNILRRLNALFSPTFWAEKLGFWRSANFSCGRTFRKSYLIRHLIFFIGTKTYVWPRICQQTAALVDLLSGDIFILLSSVSSNKQERKENNFSFFFTNQNIRKEIDILFY